MTRVAAAVLAVVLVLAMDFRAAAAPGELKAKVLEALKSIADGKCPESLMNAVLQTQCESQLAAMKQQFAKVGAVRDATYKGIEPLPTGIQAEVYNVTFERGAMIWMAALGPNGKLSVLWSPG